MCFPLFQGMKIAHPGASQDDTDYKAYSLFVYNFIKYIEWPEIDGDFVLGIVGDSPIQKELENMAKIKKAKGKNIVIKKIHDVSLSQGCHLLYLSNSKSSLLKQIVQLTTSKPVLLVAEREGLAKKGACLSFITLDDDVLKFEINKDALQQRNLKVPSALSNLGLSI